MKQKCRSHWWMIGLLCLAVLLIVIGTVELVMAREMRRAMDARPIPDYRCDTCVLTRATETELTFVSELSGRKFTFPRLNNDYVVEEGIRCYVWLDTKGTATEMDDTMTVWEEIGS